MDCNNNQRSACACTRRPQIQPPPCMNTDCGCGCQAQPAPAVRPGILKPAPGDGVSGMPIAMAYVPWQRWRQTYPLEQGLSRGTIFPELDLPFMMGRCR